MIIRFFFTFNGYFVLLGFYLLYAFLVKINVVFICLPSTSKHPAVNSKIYVILQVFHKERIVGFFSINPE